MSVQDEYQRKQRLRHLVINTQVLFKYWKYNICCRYPHRRAEFADLELSRDLLGQIWDTETGSLVSEISDQCMIPFKILNQQYTDENKTTVTLTGAEFDDM